MPIPLRSDFDATPLRRLARKTKHGPQARRLLALAAIYEGASRAEAARIGGVTRQIVRDWVVRFNALGPDGLIDRKPPGVPSRLNDTHRGALVAVIEQGPIPAVHGVVERQGYPTFRHQRLVHRAPGAEKVIREALHF